MYGTVRLLALAMRALTTDKTVAKVLSTIRHGLISISVDRRPEKLRESRHLYLCLSVSLSVSLCLSVCLSVSVCLCLPVCLSLRVFVSVPLSLFVSVSLSVTLSVCLSPPSLSTILGLYLYDFNVIKHVCIIMQF